jgi:hypothetical protein
MGMTKREIIAELYGEELLFMDPPEMYDDCIIGVAERFGIPGPVVAYDVNKLVAKLAKDGMDCMEADEFIRFNQLGAWVGDMTPIYVTPWEMGDDG